MDITELPTDLEAQESLFEHYHIQVDAGQGPYRIDKFLLDRLPHTSRTKIQLAIDNQFILVNNNPTKASYKVRPRDNIQVVLPTPPHTHKLLPENIPLYIVYEDEALLIVHKPAGMVVHPGYNNWTGTLVNALIYHFNNLPTTSTADRPGLVHRIDKDTSGLLVIAKTEASLVALAKQFYDHSITRTYYALVWGELDPTTGTIDINLDRSLQDRRVVAAYADPTKGKRAVTHYEVIEKFQYVSLIKCSLETGRTHQIRAHMKHLGHPIFGDATYGGKQIMKGEPLAKYKAFVENCWKLMPRQALHAHSLGFIHPTTQEYMYFEAPLPADFQMVLDKWKKYAHYHQLD
jgi:23S rRNA pseudouridine1911/1915/1917 synthase